MMYRHAAQRELLTMTDATSHGVLTRAGWIIIAHSANGKERASATRLPMLPAFDIGEPVSNHNWNAVFDHGISQRQAAA